MLKLTFYFQLDIAWIWDKCNFTFDKWTVRKNEKKNDTVDKTKMRRAKAFVISMLGEFAALCQSKQVDVKCMSQLTID